MVHIISKLENTPGIRSWRMYLKFWLRNIATVLQYASKQALQTVKFRAKVKVKNNIVTLISRNIELKYNLCLAMIPQAAGSQNMYNPLGIAWNHYLAS